MKTKNKTNLCTDRLIDEIDRDMHSALLCIQHRNQSMLDWRKLKNNLFLVSVAAAVCDRVERMDKLNVDAASMILGRIFRRKNEEGVWRANNDELVYLARGILSVEKMLSKLDMLKVRLTWGHVKTLAGALTCS